MFFVLLLAKPFWNHHPSLVAKHKSSSVTDDVINSPATVEVNVYAQSYPVTSQPVYLDQPQQMTYEEQQYYNQQYYYSQQQQTPSQQQQAYGAGYDPQYYDQAAYYANQQQQQQQQMTGNPQSLSVVSVESQYV